MILRPSFLGRVGDEAGRGSRYVRTQQFCGAVGIALNRSIHQPPMFRQDVSRLRE